jgi:hypothetical protein
MDINNARIASAVQRLSTCESASERKLVKALDWHFRLVDRLTVLPRPGTTVAAWLALHREVLHSAHVIRGLVVVAGPPWTAGLSNLTRLIAHLNEAIADLKRHDGKRIIPQAVG